MPPRSAELNLSTPAETRSGLDAWKLEQLPEPPSPRGLEWVRVVGPGVIVLGMSIGGGEFLLGPAAFVRYGLSLLWITLVAVWFQTLFNTEVMRYTVATGEPVFTGFMRTRPSSTAWAWFYTLLYLLQLGWPASAAVAAGAIFFLTTRHLPNPSDAAAVYYIGVGTYVICVLALLAGRRVERTLELINWVLVTCILGSFFLLAVAFAPPSAWVGAASGLFGFDTVSQSFKFIPAGADFFLLAALVAYSGGGGMANVTLANWARDKGYGMGERAGYIPGAIGGKKINLAHTGFTFAATPEAMRRWRGWWRIVFADQWVVFFCGAVLGMVLPALLYITFLPAGTDIQGLGISAALASNISAKSGPFLAGFVAFLGAWLLFKTQLDILEGMVRSITDILWTGSARLRRWRGGDVRAVYYSILAVIALWGIFALRLAQPIMLLKIAANVGGIVFVITSLHLLYINTRLLPPAVRPPLWRQAGLIGMAIFYAVFVVFSLRSLT